MKTKALIAVPAPSKGAETTTAIVGRQKTKLATKVRPAGSPSRGAPKGVFVSLGGASMTKNLQKRSQGGSSPTNAQRKPTKMKSNDADDSKAAASLARALSLPPDEKFGLQLGGLMEQDLKEFQKRSLKSLKIHLVKEKLWAKMDN